MFIMLKFAENVDNVDHFEGVHNVDNNYKIENIDNVNNDDSVMWLCFDNVVDIRQHLKNMTQLLTDWLSNMDPRAASPAKKYGPMQKVLWWWFKNVKNMSSAWPETRYLH